MKKKTIGVIVGRFETPYLHQGHSYLFQVVSDVADTVCVVLGTHGGNPTNRYPLDLETRKQMILTSFPKAVILDIPDMPSNQKWSESLDKLLIDRFPEEDITIYGSRQSFLDCYSGKVRTMSIKPFKHYSGTQIRNEECSKVVNSTDFRKGIIYSNLKRFPVVYSTVDIIPFRNTGSGLEVLLGRKEGDGGTHRVIGGFLDTRDLSHADAALRELKEEAQNISVGIPEYVGSVKIDDYRYVGSQDSVLTTLFVTPFIEGSPTPSDDMDELMWIPIAEATKNISSFHKTITEKAIVYLTNKFSNI